MNWIFPSHGPNELQKLKNICLAVITELPQKSFFRSKSLQSKILIRYRDNETKCLGGV